VIRTSVIEQPVILVVEDEPLLRLFAAEMIEDAGYAVIDVGSAGEAIAVLELRSDVRVVFTNVDMPGEIDGIKLAAHVRDRWPPIEIIITSGRPWPFGAILPQNAVFFTKPYRQAHIISTIQRMAG
jgi:CheY-like chemotaxis protein